jgi:membrane protein DedA with SNARE-associated domain
MQNFLPDFIAAWHYIALFALMFVESFVPIFPVEFVAPLGGVFAAQGKMSLVGVILAATTGSMAGISVWYWLARTLGFDRFRALVTKFGWITTLSNHEVDRLHSWFERHENAVIFLGRFVPGIRNYLAIPAGLARMPYWRFISLSALGALIANTAYATAGWLLRDQYMLVKHYVGPLTTLVIAALVLLWLVRMVMGFRKRRG